MTTSKALSRRMAIKMLSLKTCQDILNKDRKKYSDPEIKIIREELTKLSRMEYGFYLQTKRNEREEESLYLHKGIYGRTGNVRVQPEIPGGTT
jgi:hypothetical protein